MQLITNDPYELCKRRVQRGIKLLNHAKPGWSRNMFDVLGDEAYFRAKDRYNNGCVLALAFEYESNLANEFGYVTYATVSNAMDLPDRICKLFGFSSYSMEDSKLLDRAWEEILREGGITIPVRHRVKLRAATFREPRRDILRWLGLPA